MKLRQVNYGSLIVGVTAAEPRGRLNNALEALRELGVDVADVQIGGSFAFIAQKSFPSKTVVRKVLVESNNAAQLKATVTG